MRRLLLLLCLPLLLIGCGKTQDSYQSYRGLTAKEIFQQGELHLAKHSYLQATKDFEAMDALYPFSAYSQQGQLDNIYAYYKNNDLNMALAAAGIYTHRYPRSAHVDYAYYMQGLVNFKISGNWLQKLVNYDRSNLDPTNFKQSFADFSRVVEWYPNSIYAQDSVLHMVFIRNMLAKRELKIADFYYERGAYVASANRASYVVEHFSQSPETITALIMMIKSYKKLGLTEQADQAYQVLAANYPQAAKSARL